MPVLSVKKLQAIRTERLLKAQSELLLASKEAALNLDVCLKRILGEINEVDPHIIKVVAARLNAATFAVDEAIATIRGQREEKT